MLNDALGVSRREHWLRLPDLEVPDVCDHGDCPNLTTDGFVFVVMGHPGRPVLTVAACPWDQSWLREHYWAGNTRVRDLPTPHARVPIRRSGPDWYRALTVDEAVAACGPMRCGYPGCTEQAEYLTWGVDGGVPDKWWPSLLCPLHAREHAERNYCTLEEPGEYFSVDLTWTGTDWGRRLPWPLTTTVTAADLPTSIERVPERRWLVPTRPEPADAAWRRVSPDGWSADLPSRCIADLGTGCWCTRCPLDNIRDNRDAVAVVLASWVEQVVESNASGRAPFHPLDTLLEALARQLDLPADIGLALRIAALVRSRTPWPDAVARARAEWRVTAGQ